MRRRRGTRAVRASDRTYHDFAGSLGSKIPATNAETTVGRRRLVPVTGVERPRKSLERTHPCSHVIDPADYDAGELRSLAGLDDGDVETGVSLPRVEGSDYRPATPDEPSHEQCEMLVAIGGVDPEALGERPYLPTFPDVPDGRRVGRDWIVYLVRTAGEAETRDAIARYRALGWLGEEAAATLDARIDDAVAVLNPGDDSLDRADDLLSFAHVIRLLGIEAE